MRVDLLQRLKTLLEEDANNEKGVKFNLSAWSKPDSAHVHARAAYAVGTNKIPVDCGTQACALGLAAITGAFSAEGLFFTVTEPDVVTGKGMLVPTFGGYQDFEAGKEFFELSYAETHFLFDPYEYETTQGREAELEVVKRIQFLIDGGNEGAYPKY